MVGGPKVIIVSARVLLVGGRVGGRIGGRVEGRVGGRVGGRDRTGHDASFPAS